MSNLPYIIQPVEKEMKAFMELYEQSLKGHSSDFQSIIDYVSEANGKKIRPLLLLLTAKACGSINQNTLNYALVLELLHNATLIHDDVVDDTKERRGRASINAKYGNKTAVLVGDYILSIAIIKAITAQNLEILEIISNLAKNLVEGELHQLTTSNGIIIDENHYFEIIRKKTAILFSSCTEMGALSANGDEKTVEKLRLFGEYLGICFQIKDDLFDYFEQGEIGKPTGNDIREGKITLPLIYALTHSSETNRDLMLQIIKNGNFTEENITLLINFAKNNGGTNYAEEKMSAYKQKAIDLIENFPNSGAKESLLLLVDYIIERNK
ncbi:MAG: polyprenyl synthetase family protein [Candidatus Azobacteroides sp.]|nr:polyprenyl synthetase family protein [Candidatus Azobacteroides sp.]